MNIYPSILTDSLAEAQSQLDRVKELPEGYLESQTIQFDIVDGFFVDNLTLTPLDLPELDLEGLSCDLHLMVEEPLDFVYELIEIKEEVEVRAVIAQLERMTSQIDFVKEVKAQGWKAGLSLDLHTPVSAIDEEVWSELDIVQIMSIEAGFQGQDFEPIALKKIAEVRDRRAAQGLGFELIVDGGVKEALMQDLAEIGTDGVTVGSGLWLADDMGQALANYTDSIQE